MTTPTHSHGIALVRPRRAASAPKLVMGAIQGRCALPAHVTGGAAKLAEKFFTAQKAIAWAGDQVETCAEPDWLLRDGAAWRPDASQLGFEPTGLQSELVLTAGVDQHVDAWFGPVLLVVLHNDGLKFRQGRVVHAPVAGDWFIFNDRRNHGVKSGRGRATFVGWAIPLQELKRK